MIHRPIAGWVAEELWSTIRLADGSTIRNKLVIVSVAQVFEDSGAPVLDENGHQKYFVHSAAVVAPVAPPPDRTH